MKICLDPGHGGHDPGAVSPEPSPVYEKDLVLEIGKRLRNQLTFRGHEVVMTRDTDVFVALSQRVKIANDASADLYLSLHVNGHESQTAQGFECWRHTDSPQSEDLALAMLREFAAGFPELINRGVKVGNLGALRGLNMPGVMFEPEFLTSPGGRAFLTSPRNWPQIELAYADGLVGAQVAEGLEPEPPLDEPALWTVLEDLEAATARLRRELEGKT